METQYKVISADSHIDNIRPDRWVPHVEAKWRDRAPKLVTFGDGREGFVLENRRLRSHSSSRPQQLGLLAVMAGAMALLVAACGADPTATPTSAPTAAPLPEQAAPTSTPDAAALFRAEWDALIAAAQEEGELSATLGSASSRNFRPIINAWGEKFGIKPIISSGSGSEHVNRVLAEQQVGRYLVDTMQGGVATVISRMIPAGALSPVADLFIHPEVIDQSLWFNGTHWYSDPDQKFIFAFAAVLSPMNMGMRYNTDLVSQEDLDAMDSVFDYLDPKWKGKIVSTDPNVGGGSTLTYLAYVHPDIGTEWIDAFLSPELGVTFSADRKFVTDGLAKGKFHLAIAAGGSSRDIDSLATLGAPVGRLVKDFKEGGTMAASSGMNNIFTPINGPNPNAAKLWVNWWLSQEGQTTMHTMSEMESAPTLRLDVTDWGTTNPNDRREEGKSYFFFSTDPQYNVKRQEALEYVQAQYASTR